MNEITIRQKLHQYIDESDSKLLKLLYALVREYKAEPEGDVSDEFTEEDLKRYQTRRENRLSGKSKSYDWQTAKNIITGRSS